MAGPTKGEVIASLIFIGGVVWLLISRAINMGI